jgi:hypothetical protein
MKKLLTICILSIGFFCVQWNVSATQLSETLDPIISKIATLHSSDKEHFIKSYNTLHTLVNKKSFSPFVWNALEYIRDQMICMEYPYFCKERSEKEQVSYFSDPEYSQQSCESNTNILCVTQIEQNGWWNYLYTVKTPYELSWTIPGRVSTVKIIGSNEEDWEENPYYFENTIQVIWGKWSYSLKNVWEDISYWENRYDLSYTDKWWAEVVVSLKVWLEEENTDTYYKYYNEEYDIWFETPRVREQTYDTFADSTSRYLTFPITKWCNQKVEITLNKKEDYFNNPIDQYFRREIENGKDTRLNYQTSTWYDVEFMEYIWMDWYGKASYIIMDPYSWKKIWIKRTYICSYKDPSMLISINDIFDLIETIEF